MAVVVIPSRLPHHTGGEERVEVEARNVRALFAALVERYPALAAELREGSTVAIDGEIVSDPLLEPVEPDSEIHLLPPLAGG